MPLLPPQLSSVIDAQDYEGFARNFGSAMADTGLSWARALIAEGPSPRAFRRLRGLAWFIFVERQGRHVGESSRFALTPLLESFQDLVYELDVFSVIRVPFPKWQDVLAQSYPLLDAMLAEGVADLNADDRADRVRKLVGERLAMLTEDLEVSDAYCDYLNGAL